ncbi:MAG: hypothetical protein PHI12_09035 [Dehalococcoidales bacterium]|nr:hypothetical protein [Dehalococcoidales bacterium]
MEKLKSRKLIVGILAALLIIVNDALGKPISEAAVYSAIAMLGTYLVGQGIADVGAGTKAAKEKTKKNVAKELVE